MPIRLLLLALACAGSLTVLSIDTAIVGANAVRPTPRPSVGAAARASSPANPATTQAPLGTVADPVVERQRACPHLDPPTVSPSTGAAALTAAAPTTAAAPVTAPTTAAAPVTAPVAAFLGDSYSTGYNGAGVGAAGWPAIVSAALGLRPLNRAVAGTGFVNPGWTSQPVGSRLDSVIGAAPRILFLVAGHNDRRYSTSASQAAATAVIDRLSAKLPATALVVIGPIWQDARAPASLRTLNDHLRAQALRAGATFIDAIRGGWFAGSAHGFIGPDGIHPTNAGHRHIAELVLAAVASQRSLTKTELSRPATGIVTPGKSAPAGRSPSTGETGRGATGCPS
jgi:lysophospholipase L1-like esterase